MAVSCPRVQLRGMSSAQSPRECLWPALHEEIRGVDRTGCAATEDTMEAGRRAPSLAETAWSPVMRLWRHSGGHRSRVCGGGDHEGEAPHAAWAHPLRMKAGGEICGRLPLAPLAAKSFATTPALRRAA